MKTLESVEKRQYVLERFLWFSNVFVRFHSFSNVFVRFWTFWDVVLEVSLYTSNYNSRYSNLNFRLLHFSVVVVVVVVVVFLSISSFCIYTLRRKGVVEVLPFGLRNVNRPNFYEIPDPAPIRVLYFYIFIFLS